MRKKYHLFAALAILPLAIATLVYAADSSNSKTLVNKNKDGVILEGHDAVAMYHQKKLVKGDKSFTHEFQGAKYLFSSQKNMETFAKSPEKYAPLFGGYCATGVLYRGLYPVDVKTFSYVNGKLILQKNMSIKKSWDKKPEDNLKKAVSYWPGVVRKHTSRKTRY